VTVKVAPALVLKDKLVLRVGTHNGIEYAEDDVYKLYQVYKQIELKPMESRSMDEVHAFDIHRGDDEDHKDSTGTWVGDAEGVYWDAKSKGIGFHKLNIIEDDFARKIQFQKQRGKASFGVSPRLNVLRVGTKATDIRPKNISIVLSPAGGEELMLSQETGDEIREVRQDIIQELTLSEQESIRSEGGILDMDEKTILEGFEKINTRLDKMQEDKEKELQAVKEAELKRQAEELEEKNKALEAELAKKKDEEEEKGAKKKDEEDEEGKMAKKKKDEDEEKMAKKKKDEEDEEGKLQDKKKYKYYGALSAKDSLLKKFAVTPDIRLMDASSINRVAEDIVKAAKIFDSSFTLEKAQKGIEELQIILANLPANEKEEKQLMEEVETTLSSVSEQIAGKLEEKTKGSGKGGRRKGLVLDDEEEREEETLSKKDDEKIETKDDIKDSIRSLLSTGLGVK